MSNHDEARERQQFMDLLLELAKSDITLKSESERKSFFTKFEELYAPAESAESKKSEKSEFRHYYSDIFTVLSAIKDDPTKGSIDDLGQKLQTLKDQYIPLTKDISYSLNKLYDHASLDIARLNYLDSQMLGGSIANIQSEIDSLKLETDTINKLAFRLTDVQNQLDSANREVKELRNTLDNAQREYIAILGIFAAVVLTFIGGIAFSTSVLENMHQGSIYRIVVVILLIGMVLFNVLYALFGYIERMVRNVSGIRMRPLKFVNAVFLLLMIAVFLLWNAGAVEFRNKVINSQQAVTEGLEITVPENNLLF